MRTRSPTPFNPFIVLSDVTISTLVVFACLLLLFGALMGDTQRRNQQLEQRIAQLEVRKEEQALKIERIQEQLIQERKLQNRWPQEIAVLHARGLQSYLYRLPIAMFKSRHSPELSKAGRQAIQTWAELWGPELRKLQGEQSGALVEIQVRGHCSRVPGASAIKLWRLSLDRAWGAAKLLLESPDFPRHLLSVSGSSWHRRAYEPSEGAIRKGKSSKAALEDRIDIVLVFAGDEQDNNFVAAWDGERIWGPKNDVSVSSIRGTESERSGE